MGFGAKGALCKNFHKYRPICFNAVKTRSLWQSFEKIDPKTADKIVVEKLDVNYNGRSLFIEGDDNNNYISSQESLANAKVSARQTALTFRSLYFNCRLLAEEHPTIST